MKALGFTNLETDASIDLVNFGCNVYSKLTLLCPLCVCVSKEDAKTLNRLSTHFSYSKAFLGQIVAVPSLDCECYGVEETHDHIIVQ